MSTPVDSEYEIIPFLPLPERREQINTIIRKIAEHETIFSDYAQGCENVSEGCFCERCKFRIDNITMMLTKSDAIVWEVWRKKVTETGIDVDVSGILYLTDINPGGEALAHYVFFDSNLQNKTELISSMINWVFTDHAELNWRGLSRLTVEIPDCFPALAVHATKRLGFGGDYTYEFKNKKGKTTRTIPVEGLKRNALVWRGVPRNLLVLGLTAEQALA